MPRLLAALRRALGAVVPHRADWRAMGPGGLAGAGLSAALLALAFPRADLGALAWVALVPVLVVTRSRPPRAAKWLWYLFGVAWLYASLCWFNVTTYVNPLIIPGVVLMALILALHLLLFGWGAVWLGRLAPLDLLLVPLWWVAVEYLRFFGDLAFPWLFLAHTQHGHPRLIQSAAVFGTHGLSALIVAGNVVLADLVWRARRRALGAGRWTFAAAGLWAGLMAVNLWHGGRALDRWHRPPGPETRRVAIVQPAWPQPRKLEAMEFEDTAEGLFHDLLRMLRALEPGGADLVLLPESVVIDHFFPLEGREQLFALGAEARRLRAAVVFGANNAVWPPGVPADAAVRPTDLLIHNSVWALGPWGNLAGVYDKIRLVPFSESAPLISRIPGLMRLTLGNLLLFEPGTRAAPLEIPLARDSAILPLGVSVCFESTFPDIARRQVLGGAQVLATVTNDGWFLDSAGPRQHWIAQPFRAVENRRWYLRSANTGISGIIDPAGVVLARTEVGERATLRGVFAPERALTFYTRHGDWFARLSWAICAVALIFSRALQRAPSPPEEETAYEPPV